MMSEVIAGTSIVVVCGIVHILAVGLLVWVLCGIKFGVIGEEEAIPCAVLLLLLILFVAIGLVVSLEHSPLSCVHAIAWDHCWEWTKVRP